MNVDLIENQRTGRIEDLHLHANTFEEERILKELAKVLIYGGHLSTETREGGEMRSEFRPQGSH